MSGDDAARNAFIPTAIKKLSELPPIESMNFIDVILDIENPPCPDISGVIGPIALFYQDHGTVFDIARLLEVVRSHPRITISSAMVRQIVCALCRMDLSAAIRFCRQMYHDKDMAVAFSKSPPRGSEQEIANWKSLSGHTRAAIAVTGIILGACYDWSASACGRALPSHKVSFFDGGFSHSLALLRVIKSMKVPIPPSQLSTAIFLFSVPLESSYFLDAHTFEFIWFSLVDCLGPHPLGDDRAGMLAICALVRVAGQLCSGPSMVWKLGAAVVDFGFVTSPENKVMLIRSMKLALRSLFERNKLAMKRMEASHLVDVALRKTRPYLIPRVCTVQELLGAMSTHPIIFPEPMPR